MTHYVNPDTIMHRPPVESITIKHTVIPDHKLLEIREWIETVRDTFQDVDVSFKWATNNQDKIPYKDYIKTHIYEHTNLDADHIWFQYYKWDECFHAHNHAHINTKRCGLLFLDEIGETCFICDKGKSTRPIKQIPSKAGKIATFPPEMYHYVMPHCQIDQIRLTIPFNCSRGMTA